MAQQDDGGGYSNPAMDSTTEAEASLTAEELCLRVDKLEVTDSPTRPQDSGAIISSDDMVDVPGVGGAQEGEDIPLPNLTRNRPFSASTMSRETVASTRSHASRSPSILTTEYSANHLFCYRVRFGGGAFIIR